MNVTIEGGKLSLNLYDLIGEFRGEERATVIDALACQTEVIDEVMNQVIDGWTTMGSHGSTGFGGNPDVTHGMDGARMRIAKASSEIAKEEIERLSHALKHAEARINEGWDAYHKLLEERRYLR